MRSSLNRGSSRCSAPTRGCRCGRAIRVCSSTSLSRARRCARIAARAIASKAARLRVATDAASGEPSPRRPMERILIVAPAWIGDAILSEPLIALCRDPLETPIVDVLAPAWCAPVYARMRGIGRVIDAVIPHGRFGWETRKALARELRGHGYTRAIVLPNSWKSALVPWLARIPRRTGYRGEARYGLLNDIRRLDPKAVPRLVDRFAALAVRPGALGPPPPPAGLVAKQR